MNSDRAALEIDRVRSACAVAQEVDAKTEGIIAARKLLAATREPLHALSEMPGQEDATRKCRDEVARVVDACAMTYAAAHHVDKRVALLLDQAGSLATSTSITKLIDQHIAAQRETTSGRHIGSDRWAANEDQSWPTEGSDVPGFFSFIWNESGRMFVLFFLGAVVVGGLVAWASNGQPLWIAVGSSVGGFIAAVAGITVIRNRAEQRAEKEAEL